MSIPQLHKKRRHAEKVCNKANVAVEKGQITKEERDAFLRHTFNSNDEREIILAIESEIASFKDGDEAPYSMNAIALIAGFFVIMVSLFAVLFYSTGGITGAVVIDESVSRIDENRPPVHNAMIPDILAERMVVLDLADVFADPEGDALTFQISHRDQNNETIEQGVLTIYGCAGTYGYVAYALDEHAMTSSNMFMVTFTGTCE